MNLHLWSKKSISQNLANTAFLLLFPGFFFYHFAIARGFIPPLLGGYFSVVAAFCFPFIFINLKFQLSNFNNKVFLLFSLILIYTLVVTAYNYLLNKPYGYADGLAFWSLSGVFFNLVTFLIGAQINFHKILKINILFLILMFLVVVLNLDDYGNFNYKYGFIDESRVASHQGFARSIVFISLILTGVFIKKYIPLIFIFTLSVVALFLASGRSEFIFYVVSSLIMIGLNGFKLSRIFFLLVTVIIVFCFISFFLDLYPQSRFKQLFAAIQEDGSFIERSVFNRYGLSLIADNPLVGAYGMYVHLNGGGSYPHNLLSAWVNLGILGFAFYLILFFILLKAAFLGFKKNSNNSMYQVFLIFLLFTLMSIILSKDYNYMNIGFLVGIFINWKNLNIFKLKQNNYYSTHTSP
jgi:hypothetical protein